MKKITSIAFALCFALAAFAQQGIELGLRVVPQSSAILNPEDTEAGKELDYEFTTGAAFGLNVAYNFSDKLGAGINLLYSVQGQKYINKDVSPEIKSQTDLSYLKIPVLFHFNGNPESKVMFSLEAGPQFGLLLNVEESNTSNVEDLPYEAKEAFNSMDLGVALGIGADINLTENLQLTAKVRWDGSIADMENKDFTYGETTVNAMGVSTTTQVSPYADERSTTTNVAAGLMIGINYIFK